MSRPLDGVQAKLERAEHHLHSLHATVGLVFEREPVSPMVERDPESGDQVVRVKNIPDLPPYVGAILGDYLHNLRSALNHLAFELVRASGGLTSQNEGQIQFPIYDWLTDFKDKVPKLLPGVGEAPLAIIEAHQPENRPDLGRLGQLSNADKHRIPTLLLSRIMSTLPEFRSLDCEQIEVIPVAIFEPLDVGAEVVRLRLSGCRATEAHVQMKGHFIPEIAFEDGAELSSTMLTLGGQCRIIASELERHIEPRPLFSRGRTWPAFSTL